MADDIKNTQLSSEILLDIGTSLDSTQMNDDLMLIKESMDKLAAATDGVNQDLGKFSSNISNLISKELSKASSGTLNVNGESLIKSVEKAIANNILGREVNLSGDIPQGSIDVMPKATFWNKFNSKMRNQIKESIESQSIDFTKVKPFNLENIMSYISVKLNSDIGEAIKNGVDFSVSKNKRDKLQASFVIDKEAVVNVTNAFKAKLVEQLSNPANIQIEDIPKITIKSDGLKQIVRRLEDNIGNIDKYLNIDDDVLSSIPNVAQKLDGFDERLSNMMRQVLNITKKLDEINPNLDNKQVEAIMQNMTIIRNNVGDKIDNIVSTTLAEIRNMPVGTYDYSNIKQKMEQFGLVVNREIEQSLSQAVEELAKSIGIAKMNIGGRDVFVPSIQALQSKLAEASKQALDNLSYGDYTFELDMVKSILNELGNKFDVIAANSTKEAMTDIITELLNANDKILDKFKSMSSKLNEVSNVLPGLGQINLDMLNGDMLQELQRMTSEMGASEIASTRDIVSNGLTNMVHSYVEQLTGMVQQVTLSADNTSKLINSIEQRVTEGVRSCVNNINLVKPDTTDIDLSIMVTKALDEVEKAVMQSVSQWDFSTLTLPSENMESLQDSLSKQIVKVQKTLLKTMTNQLGDVVKSTAVAGAQSDTQVKDSQIKSINKATSALMSRMIKQTTQQISSMLETSGVSSIVKINDKTVSNMLKPVGSVIDRYMKLQVDSMLNAINQATSQTRINTKNLSAEVKKRISSEMEISVRQLTTNFPTLEGSSDANMVMQHSVQAIMDKFSDAAIKSTQTSLKDVKEGLNNLKIEPDITVVNILADRMNKLQSDINKKVKELLKVQFDALTQQVKGMKTYPVSVGYAPPKSLSSSASAYKPTQSNTYSIGSGYGTMRNSVTNSTSQASPTSLIDMSKFSGHVMNTLRYMTAGAIMGVPMAIMHQTFSKVKQSEYDLTKAQQNFVMKDPTMDTEALKQIYENSTPDEIKELRDNSEKLNSLIEEVAADLRYMSKDGATRQILDISNAYNQDITDTSMAYHIASRNIGNPYEALAFTQEAMKLKVVEDMDVTTAAQGLQSIQAQWGLTTSDLNKVNNMLIKTATLSAVTAEDLIQTQQTSGALFRNNLGGMTKEDAIATSFALSSLFTQATARSGKEGGTYYKAILDRPYQADTRSVLEGLAAYKGFEGLSPYKEDGVTKKDYMELLGSIIDTTAKLDDRSRVDLVKQLFPSRHAGSAEAISNLLVDMKNEIDATSAIRKELGMSEGAEQVSTSQALKEYVDNIKSADNSDTERYMAGMRSTWDMVQKGTFSMSQSLGYEFFDEYKDEFTSALSYLNTFIRVVQDNIGLVTNLAETGMALFGAKYVRDALSRYRERSAAKRVAKSKPGIETRDGRKVYSDEGLALYTDKYRELRSNEVKATVLGARRGELDTSMRDKYNEMQVTRGQLDLASSEYNKLNTERDIDPKTLGDKEAQIDELTRKYNQLEKELGDMEASMSQLDDEEKRLADSTNTLVHEMNELSGTATLIDTKLDQVEVAFESAGVDVKKFYERLDDLQDKLETGKFSMDSYNLEIRQMGRDLGMTDNEIEEIQKAINDLNDQFAKGKIDIAAYSAGLRQIKASSVGLNVASVGGANGSSLMSSMVLANSVGGATGAGSKGTSVLARLGAVGYGAKSLLGIGGKSVKAVDAVGDVAKAGGAIAKGAGVFGKAGGLLSKGAGLFGKFGKALGPLAAVATAIEVIPLAYDAVSNMYSTEGEKLTQQSQKRKDVAQAMLSYNKTDNKVLKGLQAGMSAWDISMGGINNLIGGNYTSFGEGFKVWWDTVYGDMKDASAEELEKYLKENLKYDDLAIDANVALERERLANVNPFVNSDGTLKDDLVPQSTQISLEGVQDMLSNYAENLNNALQKDEGEYTVSRLDLLLKGYSEDSEEVKQETIDFLGRNKEAIDKLVEELKQISVTLVDGQSKDLLLAQIAQYQMQSKDIQYQVQQINDSEMDSILGKLDRDRSLTEAEYSIKQSDLIIGGAPSDSSQVTSLENTRNRILSNRIEVTQNELRSLLSDYKQGTEMYSNIWLQLMQLEAEQKGLLADIKQNTNKDSAGTFNLPSGITPMTYWEAMTKNSNYKNVSVKSGDVNINIAIDKMGGNVEEVEKLSTEISKAVKDTQKSLVYQFDRDVKSGMGSKYYQHTRV